MTTKVCSHCKRELPATTEYFCANNEMRDGLTRNCRDCRAAYFREYRVKRKEYIDRMAQAEVRNEGNCDHCLYIAICRERVNHGIYVMCERPDEDDAYRARMFLEREMIEA